MIRVEMLSKAFGELQVLRDVSVGIGRTECVAVIGPSGAGKSVFLSCLNGLIRPDSGREHIDGADICDRHTDIDRVRRKMGMVYQKFNLFSHLNVMDNITLAPEKLLGLSPRSAKERAEKMLHMVGLSEKAFAMPHTLSGGQQQRIAIARAMAMEPEIVLFDEPTSALDPSMANEVLAVIRAFSKQGITMVIVTHEMEFAREVSDRVIYLDEGCIYEMGSPQEIFDHPQREKTRAFIRRLKTFRFDIPSRSFDFYHLYTEIELFCQKYRISRETSHRLQVCAEEGVLYLFNNGLANRMLLSISYSDRQDGAAMTLDYDGPPQDPFAGHADDLGLRLLRANTREILYAHDGDGSRLQFQV